MKRRWKVKREDAMTKAEVRDQRTERWFVAGFEDEVSVLTGQIMQVASGS